MEEASVVKGTCPHCQRTVAFPTELGARGIACPHCAEVFEPQRDQGLEANGSTLSASDIATSFLGAVKRRPASLRYSVALLAASFSLLLLPVLYLAMIAVLGWGLVGVAADGVAWLGRSTGGWRTRVFGSLGCTLLLIFGGLLLVSLVRPLFGRKRGRSKPLALNAAAEPLLFAFVHMICDSLGAPHPVRVDVDCRLNASAALRKGFWTLRGGDLVLTIGLPLVASLSLREFAGVLAHEFGHFHQRAGMRASTVVRGVHAWLSRVARGADPQARSAEAWLTCDGTRRTHAIVLPIRSGLWLARGVLQLFLHAGEAIRCLLLREMEWNADLCQIELAGSEEFEITFRRLQALHAVSPEVYRNLRKSWDTEHRLPDNLPRHLARAEASLTEEARRRLERARDQQEDDVFATHPPDLARIRRARELAAPGLFCLGGPATEVFSAFDVLARQVTWLHYGEDLGLPPEMIQVDFP